MPKLQRAVGLTVPFLIALWTAPLHAGRLWTLDDVLTAPEVTEVRLLHDASAAGAIVQSANAGTNRVEAQLRETDMRTGVARTLLQAPTIENLRNIPGSRDWSVLADLGKGEQLYRISPSGLATTLLVNSDTKAVGLADGAADSAAYAAPRQVGVLSYEWSPDGRWLWYAVLKTAASPLAALFDDDVARLQERQRRVATLSVEFHLRSPEGYDVVVTTRPPADRVARYRGGNVSWTRDAIRYVTEDEGSTGATFSSWTRPSHDAASHRDERPPTYPLGPPAIGPYGGELATIGDGNHRRLRETTPDGTVHDYGTVNFSINDPRGAANWRSSDDRTALIGTRSATDGLYGIVLIDTHGLHPLTAPASLTRCDVNDTLDVGVCVEEGQTMPPRLVVVHPRSGAINVLAPLSPRHDDIMPLKVTSKVWVDHLGDRASGYILWPRNYTFGHRYPAILVTHGSDADDRFANAGFQWNYPVQLFAERGYLVLLMNDPGLSLNPRLRAAIEQWARGSGPLSPEAMRRLQWLNGVASFEDAIRDLDREGVIDPDRVGIAGFSRGSQMVNVTMTQSHLFRAASSGDGGFLEPSFFSVFQEHYTAIFGGSPYGPALGNYQALSPSLRIDHVHGAVLQQLASPNPAALDFYRALQSGGKATQVTLYPGEDATSDETHIFHIPSNRMLAMRENLAWFDFWLKGDKAPEMPWPDRYDDWARMAALAPRQ